MSLKVQRHGNTIIVKNPINGQENTMINVVFTEEGRSGADESMSASNSFLDKLVGKTTGLSQIRVHTQPVLEAEIGEFPVGKVFNIGHINRELYSTPQIRQHEGVAPRMVGGKPTYFKTWISDTPTPDVDNRISNEVLANKAPDLLFGAKVGAAEVRVTKQAPVLNNVDVEAI